jgi:glutamate formiminotransferase/formiminotetrahydrofolate cyclodeaminase
MYEPLVECIPNFSEGRRAEVIDAIEGAVRTVPAVKVLDRHVDADHNRTVITFAGPPAAVVEAAFAAIARAAQLIDLDVHRGEHPRIGATDVVPFVPLSGITMEECVGLARGLGERVGRELEIPVYLYEAAATAPERVNLEHHRRGEYEGLKEAIGRDPERAPDFGPKRLGKAGATVIGARAPLIAYNVYLTTGDVEIARKIARGIRQSSGGFHFLKALGLLVEGRAQVSMNFTDFTRTPLPRVVEAIRREAARHGVAIHHSELVGLIPQAALVEAARWYLQLDQFEPDQVLETRLYASLGAETSGEGAFLARLAEGTATPGGGSAAAYAGAMAAALVGMVARLTVGKKKFAGVEARMRGVAAAADGLRERLQQAVASDSEAFDAVMAARRMPKGTEAEKRSREAALEAAMRHAGEVPLGVARDAAAALGLAAEVAESGNPSAASDAGSAGALARAALTAATMNVRVNADGLKDEDAAAAWRTALESLEARAAEAEERLGRAFDARLGPTAR